MDQPSVAQLVQSLREVPLLDAGQLAELAGSVLPKLTGLRELLTELVLRGWLTGFQAEALAAGRPQDLRLGHYLLLERLGQGGMGNVYKARHQLLNRVVALKVTRQDIPADPANEHRFLREIRATAQLAHPNIVAAHDAAQIGDVHVFAMEYVEGTDLARLVRQTGPLPIHRASEYMRQAALGLQHAHERGLVHRDIKPSNLLLTADGLQIKIVDMGLVRANQESEEGPLTKSGMVIGTPDYLAPEQATNSRAVDIRADLYSLGCTFYYLLTGRHPFPEGTALEKLFKHIGEEPTPVRDLRPEVPPELEAVLRRLMAKDPKDRYQEPAELARALEPFCEPSGEPSLPPTGKLSANVVPNSPPALPEGSWSLQSAPTQPTPVNKMSPPTPTPATHAPQVLPKVAPAVSAPTTPSAAETPQPAPEPAPTPPPPPEVAAPKPVPDPAPALPPPLAKPKPAPEPPPPSRRRWLVPVGAALVFGLAGALLWRSLFAGQAGKGPVTNSIGMELVRIPAGEFTMGAPPGEPGRRDNEAPPRKVAIAQPFYLGAHETTVAQFRAFVRATRYRTEAEKAGALRWDPATRSWKHDPACNWQNPGWPLADDQPVVCVSRLDALAFCYWLSRKEGRIYRLPTEAEWEYACRAGTTTAYATGPVLSARAANFSDAGGQGALRVGSFPPNPWGLYDMHGNAWEWCAGDPGGSASIAEGILRGGSWHSVAADCRSAYRQPVSPGTCRTDTGFRVVRESGVR